MNMYCHSSYISFNLELRLATCIRKPKYQCLTQTRGVCLLVQRQLCRVTETRALSESFILTVTLWSQGGCAASSIASEFQAGRGEGAKHKRSALVSSAPLHPDFKELSGKSPPATSAHVPRGRAGSQGNLDLQRKLGKGEWKRACCCPKQN